MSQLQLRQMHVNNVCRSMLGVVVACGVQTRCQKAVVYVPKHHYE